MRCAIYTRKSTEEGLDQEFNSLDAQRESAEAYILSQREAGWIALPERYDDGGYTGANLDRPALRRLLADIEAGRIDCVLVYKVDRLSRSLLDFARLTGEFDKRGVSFVSVTQQFNTTTSMGRLTLNILLSFAQFEREIVVERTRDKMAAARREGKWVGGIPALGYDVAPGGGNFVNNEEEERQLRAIFALYREQRALLQQGVMKDYAELARLGQVSRARITQIMNLLNLAPNIEEAILFMTGEGSAEQSLWETSVRTLSAEVIWSRQREQWKKWSAPPSDRRKKRVGAGGDC